LTARQTGRVSDLPLQKAATPRATEKDVQFCNRTLFNACRGNIEYPTKDEVELALRGMLKDRPHHVEDLSASSEALAGRPMSDVAWVVNEAARLAARAKKDMIEEDELGTALGRLKATDV
jgi:hypothetical protein